MDKIVIMFYKVLQLHKPC